MKTAALLTILTLLVLAGVPSWADDAAVLPDLIANGFIQATQDARAPLSPLPTAVRDFSDRLKAAVMSGDPGAIRALYQTNGIAAEDMEVEVARWQQLLRDNGNRQVGLYFKELQALPPTAREYWTSRAEQLTRRKVTHLVGVSVKPGKVERLLPLVIVGDRLSIVPSEAIGKTPVSKPDGAAKGSEPIGPVSNRSSPTAGSRR